MPANLRSEQSQCGPPAGHRIWPKCNNILFLLYIFSELSFFHDKDACFTFTIAIKFPLKINLMTKTVSLKKKCEVIVQMINSNDKNRKLEACDTQWWQLRSPGKGPDWPRFEFWLCRLGAL